MRFALEHQNPPVTGAVNGRSSASLPLASFSLLTVSNSDVLLWALKPAEEGIGHGVIARLWNASELSASATLTFVSGLAAAQRTTHIETDVEPVSLDVNAMLPTVFTRQQFQTYRLTPK